MCELFHSHESLDRLWPVYEPPQHERAELCYIRSRAVRLHKEHTRWVNYWLSDEDPLAYIKEALELSTYNDISREEKSRTKIWVKDHERDLARQRSVGDHLKGKSIVEWRKRTSNTARAV